jgi:hypothetical protein
MNQSGLIFLICGTQDLTIQTLSSVMVTSSCTRDF